MERYIPEYCRECGCYWSEYCWDCTILTMEDFEKTFGVRWNRYYLT